MSCHFRPLPWISCRQSWRLTSSLSSTAPHGLRLHANHQVHGLGMRLTKIFSYMHAEGGHEASLFWPSWAAPSSRYALGTVATSLPRSSARKSIMPARRTGQSTVVKAQTIATPRLHQIDRSNVHKLKVAWTFDTKEAGGLQTNPLIVGRVLFGIHPDTESDCT